MAGDGIESGIQNYVEMAAGLTKATKAKARAAARNLLATAGLEDVAADATDRVSKLAEEVVAASRANRELMGKLVAAEVDKTAGRLGFVRTEELDDLRRELAELRMKLAHDAPHEPPDSVPVTPDLGIPDPPAPVDTLLGPDEAPPIEPIDEPLAAPSEESAAKKATAKKAAAKRAAAKKGAAKKGAAKKAPAKAPSAKAATTAPAKKATAKKAPAAKQAAAQEPPAVDA